MSSRLPIFPLSIVSFPGEQVNLHIFEPRYRQLINECWAERKTFGIPVFLEDKVMEYGTEMEILEISNQHEGGEMDIKTMGLRSFKIVDFFPELEGKLYAGAEVEFTPNQDDFDQELYGQIQDRLKQLFKQLGIIKELDNFRVFDIAHFVGLTLREEYNLLKINNEKDRQVLILNHLDRIIPVIIRAQKIRDRMKMNGHFKNFDKLDFS